MKEFVEKLIERLEEEVFSAELHDYGWEGQTLHNLLVLGNVQVIAEDIASEHNNDFCEWKYDGTMYDRCPHKETLFARMHNCDEKIFKFCPYCGKEIKVVE